MKEKWLLIGAIAYILWIVMSGFANAEHTPGSGAPDWTKYIDMVDQYCLEHVDRILQGGNPVQDLMDAGLIPPDQYPEGLKMGVNTFDCSNVHKMKKFNDETNDIGLSWR